MLDAGALAAKLHRMQCWIDRHDPHPQRAQVQFDAPPHGAAAITIDPTSVARAASFNRNRIHLLGTMGGLSYDGLVRLTQMFTARQVPRCFV